MKRKRNRISSSSVQSCSQQIVAATLPDDCWETIFRFIINHYDDNHSLRYLNSLSLVSKRFLSITNRLLLSYNVSELNYLRRILVRFTNLTSLNIKGYSSDLNKLLRKISRFPLKQLTSLNISNQPTFPANGLRAFSQKITTLTSLTCSNMHSPNSLNPSHLFLIAECFPLLEQLDLSHPSGGKIYSSSYVDGVEALSLALIKLRKVNLSAFPINDQSLFHLFNNCRYLEEVTLSWCDEITSLGLASALRDKLTLRSLSFSTVKDLEMFSTSQFIDSLVSLKGLTCLVFHNLNISDELLYSIARECLPLTRVGLLGCTGHSYAGIIDLLSKCRRIQHLDLRYTDFLKDQHVVELSSFLVDLVSINLSCCHNLTPSALFTLAKNCPSLSEIKMEKIGGKAVGNSDSLGVYPQLKSLYLGKNSWLSDKIITKFASIFPNLQLLDLNNCNRISEGICQVLRKCFKIKHLNLAGCLEVKLLGMNFVVPNLEVLNLSYTKVDDETLYVISKNCRGLLQLLLEKCNGVTQKGMQHVLENCTHVLDYSFKMKKKYKSS
ncbi:F-box/LRR-repeat protein 2-like [Trifolium pratense]|uniref:F-box/LRR-repeat protein 2-like n=1 Tax=Trifolium pratense TaxID=57577 RepID=UPI001E6903FC|nr:F-box/LRR-repeat protein 2-like [Trifolium pratense]